MDKPGVSVALTAESVAMIPRRAALLAALPLAAQAQQAWPARPISMIAPLAAGSSVDILARLLAEQWSQRLGVPVPVENRPAANGTVALGAVARAAPDGHTITITGQTSVAFNPHLFASLPYDPFRDFAYLGRIAGVSNALVVRTASPIRSLADLLAAARAQPGRLTYSSGGVGSTHHLSSALLAQQAQLDVTHVPYRGAPQGILAVQSGEVDFAYYNISTLLTGIRGGLLRPLAVTSTTRNPFLPDVATMQEQGFPQYEMTTWIAVATVAGTPPPILARMEETTRLMLEDQAVQRRLVELGFDLLPWMPAAEIPALVRSEHARWGEVIRRSGARLE
jgi:tripartite-type tricarboxylate transporter receptor subunit TctC